MEAAKDGKEKAAFKEMPLCGDYDIRIAADGSWFYQGSRINRPALPKLFATVLSRDDGGDFWLITPYERGRVVVDDAPFTVVEMNKSGEGLRSVFTLRTNLDHEIVLGPDNPIRVEIDPETEEPRPYVLVKEKLEALVLRSVFYHLVDQAEEATIDGQPHIGIWSSGHFFPIDKHQSAF
jgi:uncharacterized protein